MKMKQPFFLLTMWWFILLAVAGGVVALFSPQENRISQRENRTLQNRPAFSWSHLQSGDFASEWEAFLCDSIPARDSLIDLSNGLFGIFSRNTTEDLFRLDHSQKDAAEFVMDETSVVAPDETGDAIPDRTENTPATQSQTDAVTRFIRHDGSYHTLYTVSEENITRVAANLEAYAALLPEDGRLRFTTVAFPNTAHWLASSTREYSGWESTFTDRVAERVSDKVVCYNSYAILEPRLMQGEELFLYGDHQWNAHGAYYVFRSMMADQGVLPTPFDEYAYRLNTAQPAEAPGKTDEYHLLYPLAPTHNYIVDHIDQKTEMPLMRYNRAMTIAYLHGNPQPWRKLETGFHTGRRALVIGDCFYLAFTQYLLPYYDEVHTTDIRDGYYNREKLGTSVADMITRNQIDDIYVIFSEANGGNSQTLLHFLGKNLYR